MRNMIPSGEPTVGFTDSPPRSLTTPRWAMAWLLRIAVLPCVVQSAIPALPCTVQSSSAPIRTDAVNASPDSLRAPETDTVRASRSDTVRVEMPVLRRMREETIVDAHPSLVPAQAGEIVGLRYRDLSPLGIHMRIDGVIECFSLSQERLSLAPRRGSRSRLELRDVPEGIVPGMLPVLVTDAIGTLYPAGSEDHGVAIDLDALVALKVRGASLTIDGGDDNDIILWYSLSPELLGRLPACTRDDLLAELDRAAVTHAHRLDPERRWLRGAMAPPERRRFDSILMAGPTAQVMCVGMREIVEALEIARSERYAIPDLSIAHAPVASAGKLKLTLATPGWVTVTLHSLDGVMLRTLISSGRIPEGSHQLTFSSAGIDPGMYIARIVAAGYPTTTRRLLIR